MIIERCKSCLVKKSSAVNSLSPIELLKLEENTMQLHYTEGHVVFKQNDVANNIFYLKEGLVKLSMKGVHRDKIIKLIKAPNYIGLAASLGNDIFTFSAFTLEKSTICVTNKETYFNLIESNSKFSLEIIKHLSNNELTQYGSCVKLVQQNLNGRIAACLINLSENIFKSNKVKILRKDLSDIIGQSRENTSRVISQFNRDGIINLNGNDIEILDMDRLKSIRENG